jgi:hypothetical protein
MVLTLVFSLQKIYEAYKSRFAKFLPGSNAIRLIIATDTGAKQCFVASLSSGQGPVL